MSRFTGFMGIAAPQYLDELNEFLEFVKGENISRYLEVGLCCGITFHAVASLLAPDSVLVGVDLPQEDPDGPAVIGKVVTDLEEKGYSPHIIWGASQTDTVIEAAQQLGPYDLVFIDGGHSWDCVSNDWEQYGVMGRIVAFHDINSSHVTDYGVSRLWGKLKQEHRHREIVGQFGGMGIGILWKD